MIPFYLQPESLMEFVYYKVYYKNVYVDCFIHVNIELRSRGKGKHRSTDNTKIGIKRRTKSRGLSMKDINELK